MKRNVKLLSSIDIDKLTFNFSIKTKDDYKYFNVKNFLISILRNESTKILQFYIEKDSDSNWIYYPLNCKQEIKALKSIFNGDAQLPIDNSVTSYGLEGFLNYKFVVECLPYDKNVFNLSKNFCAIVDRFNVSFNENNDIVRLELSDYRFQNFHLLNLYKEIRHLGLQYSRVMDISFTKELKKLTLLDISKTYVKDISPLQECEQLHTLYLNSLNINAFQLKSIKSLKNLYLCHSAVLNQFNLLECKNLKYIHITNIKMFDSNVIGKLKNNGIVICLN